MALMWPELEVVTQTRLQALPAVGASAEASAVGGAEPALKATLSLTPLLLEGPPLQCLAEEALMCRARPNRQIRQHRYRNWGTCRIVQSLRGWRWSTQMGVAKTLASALDWHIRALVWLSVPLTAHLSECRWELSLAGQQNSPSTTLVGSFKDTMPIPTADLTRWPAQHRSKEAALMELRADQLRRSVPAPKRPTNPITIK